MSLPDIILVNLGTPEAPTPAAVRRFLAEFLADPMVVDLPRWLWTPILRGIILRRRPARVAEQYRAIWSEGGSPLAIGTRRMVTALAGALGDGRSVEQAYRYGAPGLAGLVQQRLDRQQRPVRVVPLFPQPTAATTGTVEALVSRLDADRGLVEVRTLAADAPGYIEALVDRCRETFAAGSGPPDQLLISFHGIPVRVDRKEQQLYSRACSRTAEALRHGLGLTPETATLCYQSRFGPEPWLGPATFDLLEKLPSRGAGNMAVVCPGFLTEGLETLEEIGVRGRQVFEVAGGESLRLVPAVEDHPAMIRCLLETCG